MSYYDFAVRVWSFVTALGLLLPLLALASRESVEALHAAWEPDAAPDSIGSRPIPSTPGNGL